MTVHRFSGVRHSLGAGQHGTQQAPLVILGPIVEGEVFRVFDVAIIAGISEHSEGEPDLQGQPGGRGGGGIAFGPRGSLSPV